MKQAPAASAAQARPSQARKATGFSPPSGMDSVRPPAWIQPAHRQELAGPIGLHRQRHRRALDT
eukprot:scaffold1881_cov256-Pinguiococcus_pyrenoidosus.AAC.12